MKQPTFDGLAAGELLYGSGQEQTSDSKIATSFDIINPRPSIIPGVKGPTTDREERIMNAAYAKGYKDADRLHQASKTEDPMLTAMREAVTLIRKEKGLE